MPEPLQRIDASDVRLVAAGAAFLGSGGGGQVSLGEQLLRRALGAGAVDVVPAAALPPTDLVIHAGVAGAPYVMEERPLHGENLGEAVRAVADSVGGTAAAVGIPEIGGLNALMPLVAAATLGLPVVDGDLMGRAFPRLEQTSLALAGLPVGPMALVGSSGETVLFTNCSNSQIGGLLWANTEALGGATAIAVYPTTAGVLSQQGITGSLSLSHFLGTELEVPDEGQSPRSLAERIGAEVLFEGRVDEVKPRTHDFPGAITAEDYRTGQVARVDYMDEYLTVALDCRPSAATPDVLAAIDVLSLRPVGTERLRRGQFVAMLRLPAVHDWPPEAAALVGPAAFGLEGAHPDD